jgi:hypothetical protein
MALRGEGEEHDVLGSRGGYGRHDGRRTAAAELS